MNELTTRSKATSSIIYKAWMALTGIFLVLFLVVHMLGNLQLFLPEDTARDSFNGYSQLLTSSPFIKVAGWLVYASVAVHVLVSAILTRHNRRRRTRAYANQDASASSPWYTRSMGWLGLITLVFLVWHMQSFWYRYHWGPIGFDANGNKDLYTVVVASFCEPWVVAIYVACMIALGFHLQHGLAASLRSLGLFSRKLDDVATRWAAPLAWGIAGPFALMPLYVFAVFGGQAP